MPTGPVKWFDSKKGFGFIVGPSGQDVFVHFSSIDGEGFRACRDGETVEYELTSGRKGFAASHVRHLLSARPSPAAMQRMLPLVRSRSEFRVYAAPRPPEGGTPHRNPNLLGLGISSGGIYCRRP